ncbi:uncharacterized protein [Spinacia oleracea]|uniref:At1g61320/AtMIF1 LRR domain-containing protein n=1 Tax=Spinacia oleracea TaxID=3562 RepID=A0ABM3QZM6_SPIOL|nr:uncharacterized protein LOC110791650 [Spinacia oleracea]
MKEIVQSYLVSKKWKTRLSGRFPSLIVEDPLAMQNIKYNSKVADEERSKFVSWVNHIVDEHQGPYINEFKVVFDLDNSFQYDIDKWVDYAIAKRAKKLVLHLKPPGAYYQQEQKRYTFPDEYCKATTFGFRNAITSLSLNDVNITLEMVENLIKNCLFLEYLCIEEAPYLSCIRSSVSSSSLKHLQVSRCNKMELIDISVPKLLSFAY